MVINNVDDLFKNNCDNFNEVRDCLMTPNAQSLRTPFIFSSDEKYIARVQHESNNIVEDN